ncbi:hypothetical protein LCGC14_2221570, partial [marine sediment metagenome]
EAEGIGVWSPYDAMQSRRPWVRHRRTYGRSGYPWPEGQSDQPVAPDVPLPNCEAAVAASFLIPIHENWSDREIDDTVAALEKVARAYSLS